MNQLDQKMVTNIINDFTTTQLSSYQIAYKYKLFKNTVERLGRSHLGDAIYEKKEKLAFGKLVEQIKELQQQEVTISQIAIKLGVSKSTMFKIIEEISKEEEHVQLISVEHPEENKEQVENSNLLPVIEEEKEKYNNYHYPTPYKRNRHSGDADYAKIQVNGIQLSFNPNQENIFATISKIISVIQE